MACQIEPVLDVYNFLLFFCSVKVKERFFKKIKQLLLTNCYINYTRKYGK